MGIFRKIKLKSTQKERLERILDVMASYSDKIANESIISPMELLCAMNKEEPDTYERVSEVKKDISILLDKGRIKREDTIYIKFPDGRSWYIKNPCYSRCLNGN
jgi:hypothetical protein